MPKLHQTICAVVILVGSGISSSDAQEARIDSTGVESAHRGQASPNVLPQMRTAWLAHTARCQLSGLEIPMKSQANETVTLRKLLDRPAAVTFFYSRCTSAQKCCSAIGHLASLSRKLSDARVDARLLAITFEPQYDSPELLRDYGKSMGVPFSDRMLMLRADADKQLDLVKKLDIPVSYREGWVSLHGIALIVFDCHGRIARRYHTLMWNNDEVFEDLKRLTVEE